MVEVMVASMIMVLIFGGTAAMMVSTMRCYESEVTQNSTDTDAVMAMQLIVNNVREAKSVSITSGGAHLTVTPPLATSSGYYDRSQADTSNQIDYYLSDTTGQTTRTGTCLWQAASNNLKLVKKDVSSLIFEYDTARSIKITINTSAIIAGGSRSTELTQRVVYLRNY